MYKKSLLIAFAYLVFTIRLVNAQSLSESILAKWQSYIFVSTLMPRSELETLAIDSLSTRTTLLFNGFGKEGQSALQKYVYQVNQSCCGGKASFAIDPLIFSKYKVVSAPTFLIAKGSSTLNNEFSIISGNMEWSNALKYWAQDSQVLQIRVEATNLFSSFAK